METLDKESQEEEIIIETDDEEFDYLAEELQ